MENYFYEYHEAIDEAYHTETGIEYEVGYNKIKFNDPKKALDYYNNNLSHWTSWIVTNDAEFVKDNPKISQLTVVGNL